MEVKFGNFLDGPSLSIGLFQPHLNINLNSNPTSSFAPISQQEPTDFQKGLKFRQKGQFQEAIKCFEKAAKSSDEGRKEASNSLGMMFLEGEGVPRDTPKAKDYFLKAACLPRCKRLPQEQWVKECKTTWENAKKEWNRTKASVEAVYNLAKLYGIEKETHLKDEAMPLFELAARAGYIPAQLHLVKIYNDPKQADPDKVSHWGRPALLTCRKASELGDMESQYWLARIYEKGWGLVLSDSKIAVYWYKKAAYQGHAKAQSNLGGIYSKGAEGVPKDYKKARRWLKKAAKQGHVGAQYNLGVMYDKGYDVDVDYEKARHWYEKAAEQENANAQFNLGVLYHNGLGVKTDYKKARHWYEKARHGHEKSAEEGDDTNAQHNLGVLYYEGLGVGQDLQKAQGWWQKAADKGLLEAQLNMGVMYHRKGDSKKARHWLQKAAEQGDAEAQTALGNMYSEGDGGEPDKAEAQGWLQKAADQGFAKAQHNLGAMYYQQGDLKKARHWLELAAKQDHAGAQYSLGTLYLNSQIGNEEYSEARRWLQMAVEQGLAVAWHALGVMEDLGLGGEANPSKAGYLWRGAAEQGLVEAQYRLGVMYNKDSEAVRSDHKEAYIYLEMALKLLEKLRRNDKLMVLAEMLGFHEKRIRIELQVALTDIPASARANAETEIEKRMEILNQIKAIDLTEINKGFQISDALKGKKLHEQS